MNNTHPAGSTGTACNVWLSRTGRLIPDDRRSALRVFFWEVMKMSSDFKIDRPGVYLARDGEEVMLWPTFSEAVWQWVAIGTEYPSSYSRDGCYWCGGEPSPHDIVAYIGPLPADILQRMAEALASAECNPQDTTPATFREALQALAEEPKQ
jgi:hypothetical protein